MESNTWIILLDGSKGAGKTTAGEILVERLENTVFLSLDNERRALKDQSKHISERNKVAFDILMTKNAVYLSEGTSIVVDCGLIEERISRIEALAREKGSRVYKFLLKASYESQLKRVRSRDSARGRETDEKRFAEVHAIVHAKEFNDFTVIDTDLLNPHAVADTILSIVTE